MCLCAVSISNIGIDYAPRGYILPTEKYTSLGYDGSEEYMAERIEQRTAEHVERRREECDEESLGQRGKELGQAGMGKAAPATCCHHKETPRAVEFQDSLQRRLNRVIGQLNGVKSMIDDNRYCGDVLTQLAAAESAIRSISSVILQDHLETCVTDRVRRGDDSVIDETMQLIKRFAR